MKRELVIVGEVRLERISDNYWTVYDGTDRELGSLLGGGPTRSTRWKAISVSNGHMDPDAAPAVGYAGSRDAAAELLEALTLLRLTDDEAALVVQFNTRRPFIPDVMSGTLARLCYDVEGLVQRGLLSYATRDGFNGGMLLTQRGARARDRRALGS